MTHGYSPLGPAPGIWQGGGLCLAFSALLPGHTKAGDGGMAGLPHVLSSPLEKGQNGHCPLRSRELLPNALRGPFLNEENTFAPVGKMTPI